MIIYHERADFLFITDEVYENNISGALNLLLSIARDLFKIFSAETLPFGTDSRQYVNCNITCNLQVMFFISVEIYCNRLSISVYAAAAHSVVKISGQTLSSTNFSVAHLKRLRTFIVVGLSIVISVAVV